MSTTENEVQEESTSTVIQKKEFVRMLAKKTGYRIYEVEDILHGLAILIGIEIAKGNTVKVKGLGDFIYKKPRKITHYSTMTGKNLDVISKTTCKFKPESVLLNFIKEAEEIIKAGNDPSS